MEEAARPALQRRVIGSADPRGRVRQAKDHAAGPRKQAGVSQRAKQVGAAKDEERPAGEREQWQQAEITAGRRQRVWLDGGDAGRFARFALEPCHAVAQGAEGLVKLAKP